MNASKLEKWSFCECSLHAIHIRTTSRQCHVIHTSLHTLKLLLHCSDSGKEVVLSISISSSNRQYLCCTYSGETLLSLAQLVSVLEVKANIISTLRNQIS